MTSIRIKPIIPDLNLPDFQKIAQTELRREVVAVKRELALPTKRWKHKVEFYERQATGAQSSAVEVGTDDKPYGWTDKGTKRHLIRPKKAKALAFNSNFRAKTKPDSLNSSAGKNAPPVVFAKAVNHPGTKARGFTKQVLKRSKIRFYANVDKAVRRAVARANRG
jgi:hypothetical protein